MTAIAAMRTIHTDTTTVDGATTSTTTATAAGHPTRGARELSDKACGTQGSLAFPCSNQHP
jgi:hypothetical protein